MESGEGALMSGNRQFMGITVDVLNGGIGDSESEEEEETPRGYVWRYKTPIPSAHVRHVCLRLFVLSQDDHLTSMGPFQ